MASDDSHGPLRGGLPPGHLTIRQIEADFVRREALRVRSTARAMGLTRRELLQALAAGATLSAVSAAASAAASVAPSAAASVVPSAAVSVASPDASASGSDVAAPARSRVVVVTHPEVLIKDYRASPPIIRQMLDRAVMELSGAKTDAEAWRQVGHEGDFVAIKYNAMGRPTLESHTEIHEAVIAQLTALSKVDAKKILAVDRTVPAPWDELSEPFTLPSRGLVTRLRRLYTDAATVLINVSVLKSHFGEGQSAALKNHLGSINNPAAYHGWEPGRMPLSIPELNALAPIRTKTRLVIIDAIRPLYAGGPTDNPEYRWDYRGLIVSKDPVAAEAVGLRILESKRAEVRKKEWPMTAARLMVAHAQKIGLGQADPARIDLVEIKMG